MTTINDELDLLEDSLWNTFAALNPAWFKKVRAFLLIKENMTCADFSDLFQWYIDKYELSTSDRITLYYRMRREFQYTLENPDGFH